MKAPREFVSLPRWLVAWHLVAAVALVVLVWVSFQNLQTSTVAVVEMRSMNAFWTSLVARQDSINAANARRRAVADSLRRDSLERRD